VNKQEAEFRIAGILRDLETQTGQWIERIDVQDLETTAYSDKTQQLRRSVVIELRPVPGSSWETS